MKMLFKNHLQVSEKCCFVGLGNLDELHIHAYKLTHLELQSLDGLEKLNVLVFFDCGRLDGLTEKSYLSY